MSKEFILGTVLGFVFNFIASYFIEKIKSPNFEIKIGNKTPSNPLPYNEFIHYSFLHLNVKNINKFGITNPALGVKAKITFKNSNGEVLFSLDGRWSSNPQPIIPLDDYGRIARVNTNVYPLLRKIDILPGATEELDLAIKYSDEDSIYAFSNESYEPSDGKIWRKSNWELKDKQILFNVMVYSGDVKKSSSFILNNPSRQEFEQQKNLAARRTIVDL